MKAFFSALLAAIMAVFSFFTTEGSLTQLLNKGDITGYSETVNAEKELPTLSADENGDFTVLQISDTHFKTGLSFSDVSVMQSIETQIKEYSPDLAILSGDILDGGETGAYNKQLVLDKLAGIFEELGQYWAYIPGNNDGLTYGTSSDVTAYLTQFEHCLCADIREISGGAQYSIDIEKDGSVTHSLVFLDTMDYDNEDDVHIYGYVHADQVEWCKNEMNAKLEKYGNIGMSVFIHENTPNFAKAALNGEAYKDGYSQLDEVEEKYDIPKNEPLDEIFNMAGVGLVSIGHVHPSDCKCSFYNGTYYHITPKAEVASTLITIHTTATDNRAMYDFKQIAV